MKPPKFKNISPHNAEVIKEFVEYRIGTGVSNDTAIGDRETLKRFADFLGEKKFIDATKQDMEKFLTTPMYKDKEQKKQIVRSSKDLMAIRLKVFYRRLLGLKKREIPDIIEWYTSQTRKSKARLTNPDELKKHLISKEEYEKLIDASFDGFGQYKALWETMFLSGGRKGEILSMKIGDVKIDKEGHATVTLPVSKSKPRHVFLSKPAKNLERWIHNHPLRNEPDFEERPLWVSLSNHNRFGHIGEKAINRKLHNICKTAGIKSITTHDFRKTRATEMFNERSKDGGLIYSDKQMAMNFGWTINTVGKRREEYDLNGEEELKTLIFNNATSIKESYDSIKSERDEIINKQKTQVDKLQYQVHELLQEREQRETIAKSEYTELKKELDMLKQQFKLASKQR